MQRSSKGKEDPYFFHSVSQPLFSERQTITKNTQTLFEQIFDRLFYLAAVRRDGAYVGEVAAWLPHASVLGLWEMRDMSPTHSYL